MGMFDWVNVRLECPICKNAIEGFQSKDNACTLEILDPKFVSSFYTTCDYCKSWIEFNRPELPEFYKPRPTPFSLEEVTEMGFTFNTNPRYPIKLP